MKARQVDLAYIAGFFDGEGSVMVSRPKGHIRIEVAVSQNTRTVLDLHTRFFGGHVYGYAPKSRPRAIMYQWKVYGEAACAFLSQIIPYLHVKKVESQEGIDAWLQRNNPAFVEALLARRAERKRSRLEWLNSSETETPSTEPLGSLVDESLAS